MWFIVEWLPKSHDYQLESSCHNLTKDLSAPVSLLERKPHT